MTGLSVSALPRLVSLVESSHRVAGFPRHREHATCSPLPAARRAAPAHTSHTCKWLDKTLSELGISSHHGFAYPGHSFRSGGSSAAEAMGVSCYRGNWLGGYVAAAGRTHMSSTLHPPVCSPHPGGVCWAGCWRALTPRLVRCGSTAPQRRTPLTPGSSVELHMRAIPGRAQGRDRMDDVAPTTVGVFLLVTEVRALKCSQGASSTTGQSRI
jgi:hypothetical protein